MRLHRRDVDPADVELVLLDRELGRGRVGVVVVVQFLAADDHAPGRDVGAGVGGLEVAVAPVVADAVDDAGGGDRDPQHLDRPDRQADDAEQRQVQDQHQADTLPAVARVQVALDPVVGRAVAELGHGLLVLRLGPVQLGAAPQHGLDAAGLRAVRVVHGLALGVVLAVDGHPLLGDHAGAQPQPEAEEVRRDRAQVHRAVRLRAVQEDGDRGDGDVRGRQRVQDELPPGQVPQAVGQPVDGRVQHGGVRKQHTSGVSFFGARHACRQPIRPILGPGVPKRRLSRQPFASRPRSGRPLMLVNVFARKPRRSRPLRADAATGAGTAARRPRRW